MRVVLFLVMGLGISGTPAAQECVRYETYMRLVGSGWDGGDDIVVAGSYAYVSDEGLEVFDLSNPPAPVRIAGVTLPIYGTSRLALAGSLAYVAGGGAMYIIDISNPISPVVKGSMSLPSSAGDIEVTGGRAYVADRTAGLLIVDVSNPVAPFVVGSLATSGSAEGVEISGSRAYLADGSAGLLVIDVSNPAAPSITGAVDTPGIASDVAAAGMYAFVADGWMGGLQVVDVSVATAPVIVSDVDTPGYASRIALRDGTAFLVDRTSNGALQTIDVSDPVRPRLSGRVVTPGSSVGVALAGRYAFIVEQAFAIGDSQGFQVIDISRPASPAILGSLATPAQASKVAVAGGRAFVVEQPSGLLVIDTSTSPPALLGSAPAGPGYDIAVSGGHACVADGQTLEVFDVSNPAVPRFIRSVGTPAMAVALAGDYAYVAAGSRLDIVDVSNPASAAVVGSAAAPAADVALEGDLACTVGGYGGLTVIDVSIPRAPRILASITSAYGGAVAMAGHHACVISTEPGPQGITYARFQVVDVSDLWPPIVVRSLYLVGSDARDIAVSGACAYVAEDIGVEVIDVSSPASAYVEGSAATPGAAWGIAAGGGRVCVAAGGLGLLVLPAQCTSTDADPRLQWQHRSRNFLAAAPNPMRAWTTFLIDAPGAGPVDLRVYDPAGRLVRTLFAPPTRFGLHEVTWDGCDAWGSRLASGVYFARLDRDGGAATRRVTLLR